jgi:hypothetical protein
MINLTVYVVGAETALYTCCGFCVLPVPPSPKFQLQDVGVPDELSVKLTVKGPYPLNGVPVKLATGAACDTEI